MRFILFVFALINFAPMSATAGTIIGNSAHAVICKAEGNTTYQLLDLMEYPELVPALPQGKTAAERAIFALERYAQVDPVFAGELRVLLDDYLANQFILPFDENIAVINDVGTLGKAVLRDDCSLHQLAIINLNPIPSLVSLRYVINANFWQHMDPDHRAATYLHEVVYIAAIKRGATDSAAVRRFTARLVAGHY